MRVCRQTFGTAIPPSCLVITDHLSARSSSVTWVHWNVINFACRQHTTFTSCQNAAFSNKFFLWPIVLQVELNLSNFYPSRTIRHRFWHTLSLRQILAGILNNLTVGMFGLLAMRITNAFPYGLNEYPVDNQISGINKP